MQVTKTPGMAYAVVRGQQVVARGGWGKDGNGDAVTARTPFVLGSVSKSFTALTVMQLVEDGKVELEARVQRYLPWFRLAGAATSKMTVRDLLQHTSGIPTQAGLRYDGHDIANDSEGLVPMVRELAEVAPVAAPGQEYHYSGANYMVLGALVEEVSNESFGSFLRRRVLEPLGMRDAATDTAEAREVGVPPGHRYYFGNPRPFDRPFVTSGVPYGYLAASVTDVAHFAIAQLNGGRYGTGRVLSAAGVALTHEGTIDTGDDQMYGLGWRDSTLEAPEERIVWHSGSTPSYHAMIILSPRTDEAVIVLQNLFGIGHGAEFNSAAFGAARIMLGAEPDPSAADPFFGRLLAGLLIVAALLAIVVAWPLVGLAARRRTPALARSRTRIAVGTTAWVLLSLALATTAGYILPRQFGGTDLGFVLLWALDIGQALIAVLVLSLVLATERLILGIRAFMHTGPQRSTPL